MSVNIPKSKYSENRFTLEKIAEIMQGFDMNTYGDFIKKSFSGNAIYFQALNIFNICKPIAATLISLIFMLEFARITIEAENDGLRSFEIPMKTIVKCVVCLSVFNATPQIMQLIFNIPQEIVGHLSMNGAFSGIDIDLKQLGNALDDLKLGGRFMTAIQVFIIYLVYMFAGFAVKLVLLGRLVEIYIFFALSPLPMAMVGNKDLNSITKKFLKSFAAVCIQGAVLFIILSFYPALVAESLASSSSTSDLLKNVWGLMFLSIVLVVCIFQSSKYSKIICDAA